MGAVVAAQHRGVIVAGELVVPLVEREAAALEFEDRPVIAGEPFRRADCAVKCERAGHQLAFLSGVVIAQTPCSPA